MKSGKPKRTILVTGVINMLENKSKRMWAVYTPDGCYYIENGIKIPADVFEAQYPLTLDSNAIYKGNPLDGRTNWIK